LRRTARQLAAHVRSGGYVLGLEPSCTAVFRSDAPDLLAGDQDILRLRDQTLTLAELLMDHTPGWSPPRLDDQRTVDALAQVHCHQHAITGWDADARLLEAAGVNAEHLESGCCGLAGNFGFVKGHGDVSVACAERVLLPRVREASQQTVILADGFSCRTQIHELDSVERDAVHLAEVLAAAQQGSHSDNALPERWLARRTSVSVPAARYAALGGLGAIAGAVGFSLARAMWH